MKIKTALIQFNELGTPVAKNFDDVYFSNEDGKAETIHVFINGNQLEQAFQGHQHSVFYIAETGFGTGLNCALAIEYFNVFRLHNPEHILKQLHIISVEKHPLSEQDLAKALIRQPTQPLFKQQLLSQYPYALSGIHRMHFGDAIIDLHFGDAISMLSDLQQTTPARINAWFLDGFAPSKNPDMWSHSLFSCMAKLSTKNASLATFTAAGFVRRGLMDVGFSMRKVKGFGRKREMLIGRFNNAQTQAPRFRTPAKHVAIIGAGLAGANLAVALARRGAKVTLIDGEKAASGASGNPQGGFYPQLHAQVSNASLIQALSFDYARRYYHHLLDSGYHFTHDFCGVIQLAFSDVVRLRQQKMQDNAPWPKDLIYPIDRQEACSIADLDIPVGGLFIPHGGWICPPELVRALLNYANSKSDIHLIEHREIRAIHADSDKLKLEGLDTQDSFDHLVITAGAQSNLLPPFAHLPFGKTRGQVESVPVCKDTQGLATVLCHKGYMTPSMHGRQALGSTYARNDTTTDYRIEDAQVNFATHKKALANAPWLLAMEHDYTGRAATRMTLPDHQPAIGCLLEGSLQNKVSILSGLGSRGLTTAPLMAEILASELFNQPVPIQHKLYQALHYSRFAKRAAAKNPQSKQIRWQQ